MAITNINTEPVQTQQLQETNVNDLSQVTQQTLPNINVSGDLVESNTSVELPNLYQLVSIDKPNNLGNVNG
jgi:hypothetical protein